MINWNFAKGFHPATKAWIYQSNRELTAAEANEIDNAVKAFSKEWTSHKMEVKATGAVLRNRFIVLLADETQNAVGGCSIDSSVKFIRSIENHFSISLLDRSILLFEHDGIFKEVLLSQLDEKISSGEIQPTSIYYNNTVTSLDEMKNKWQQQVKDSWIATRLKQVFTSTE